MGEPNVVGKTAVPVSLCPPQILYERARDRSRVSAIRGQRSYGSVSMVVIRGPFSGSGLLYAGPYLGILRPWAQENFAPPTPSLICSHSVM
jgi:hypothetical protein